MAVLPHTHSRRPGFRRDDVEGQRRITNAAFRRGMRGILPQRRDGDDCLG